MFPKPRDLWNRKRTSYKYVYCTNSLSIIVHCLLVRREEGHFETEAMRRIAPRRGEANILVKLWRRVIRLLFHPRRRAVLCDSLLLFVASFITKEETRNLTTPSQCNQYGKLLGSLFGYLLFLSDKSICCLI
jgi:hypothetical protein